MTGSDEARFASLYERYSTMVAAYCRRRASVDEVEDLTAEVFLTIWRKIDQAPADDAALRWVYRISFLVLTNHWRRKGRTKKLESRLEAVGVIPDTPVHDQIVMRQELVDVMAAVSRLRPKDQEILRLSLWEHLSHDDIGAVLDIEPNAARQRLHRARKALVREHDRRTRRAKPHTSPAAQEGGEW